MNSDRTALVTGAARGIGAATVARLLADGYTVTAVDACRGQNTLPGIDYPLASRDDLAAIAADHDRVLPLECDVRDLDALTGAVEATLRRFGRLDVTVAAAGVIAGGQPLWQTPAIVLDILFDINVKGVWNAAAASIPAMLAGDGPQHARFVAVASAAARYGLFHLAAYTASKHAVVGIVRGLAADLTGTGVTACAVCPGSTRTPMLTATANLYGTDTDTLTGHQAIGRLLEPEEIAAVIALCTSADGAVLNGAVIDADGGFQP